MKKMIFACAMAALVAACAHKTTPTSSTPTASSTPAASTPAPATPAPAPANSATARIEAGHQVYNAKCGRCHALKEVSNYTAERWVPIMQSMAPKAKLNEEETANVMAYVQANAKKA